MVQTVKEIKPLWHSSCWRAQQNVKLGMKFIKWLFTIHWWYFLPEPIDLIYSLNKNPSSKSLLHCRVENSSCTVEFRLLVQPHHRILNSQLKGRFWGRFYDMRKHWWNNSVLFIPFYSLWWGENFALFLPTASLNLKLHLVWNPTASLVFGVSSLVSLLYW